MIELRSKRVVGIFQTQKRGTRVPRRGNMTYAKTLEQDKAKPVRETETMPLWLEIQQEGSMMSYELKLERQEGPRSCSTISIDYTQKTLFRLMAFESHAIIYVVQ